MSPHRRSRINLFLSALLLMPCAAHAEDSTNGRLEITGDYRYAARESEPVTDAKSLASRKALRLAVVNSQLNREQTGSLVDSPLMRNPGATAVLKVPMPATAKTYRVWLVK
jgi:hypothetical protein